MIVSFCRTMTDFSFRGRSSRKVFRNFIVIWLLISALCATIILSSMIIVLGLKIDFETGSLIMAHKMRHLGIVPFVGLTLTSALFAIFQLWSFVMASLLSIRRLHDLNSSGIYYWVWLSAFILFHVSEASVLTGFLFYFLIGSVIALMSIRSYQMPNKYGKVDIDEIILSIEQQHG